MTVQRVAQIFGWVFVLVAVCGPPPLAPPPGAVPRLLVQRHLVRVAGRRVVSGRQRHRRPRRRLGVGEAVPPLGRLEGGIAVVGSRGVG